MFQKVLQSEDSLIGPELRASPFQRTSSCLLGEEKAEGGDKSGVGVGIQVGRRRPSRAIRQTESPSERQAEDSSWQLKGIPYTFSFSFFFFWPRQLWLSRLQVSAALRLSAACLDYKLSSIVALGTTPAGSQLEGALSVTQAKGAFLPMGIDAPGPIAPPGPLPLLP